MSALRLQSVSKRYGGIVALDRVSIDIDGPGIYGLIGPNGAGKTTLFDVIAGAVRPDSGQVIIEGVAVTGQASHQIARLGITRTFQECRILLEESCLDNLRFAAQPKGLLAVLSQTLSRSGAHHRRVRDQALDLLRRVNLHDYADAPAAQLSFGQRRLLEIVCSFIVPSRVMLLDEPAAGVNPALLEVLADFIRSMFREQPRIFLLVEHNMEFVMSLAQDIIVMHQGTVLERGTPKQVQASERVLEAYLG